MKILVINGPNMDMLGKRNPALYGDMTLKQLSKKVSDFAKKKGVKTVFFQSACEGKIVRMMSVVTGSKSNGTAGISAG